MERQVPRRHPRLLARASPTLGTFATRLCGSPDLYDRPGQTPHKSVNYITSHDGFTLADLVSYNEKHNEANCEDNRDGDNHNHSDNCGREGPTDDPEDPGPALRRQKNLLATLFLSQGVPMLLGGDEFGRTQQGSNNAYCQDNEISWVDWESPVARTGRPRPGCWPFSCMAARGNRIFL
jgi:isoamylase